MATDPDAVYYAEILQSLKALDPWLARMDLRVSKPLPQAGSPMEADDEGMDPYQISHASWSSLVHAVDHLDCLRVLIRDAQMLHRYVPYTLLRAALENACCALWMLQPPSRQERIARRLRLAVNDIEQADAAWELAHHRAPRTKAERLQQVYQIAELHGVDGKPRSVGYGQIVKAVGKQNFLLVFWKTCSGMAHGDLWPILTATRMTQIRAVSADAAYVTLTADMRLLARMIAITVAVTAHGWELFDQRSQSPTSL